MKHPATLLLAAAAMLLASAAHAGMSAHNTDDVLPNSPFKALGQPDAGDFNPTGPDVLRSHAAGAVVVAPAAMTYYPPATVITERPRKPYALVAAPTLPCAPAYCVRRVRVDRN
jgi:hypothetical protein